MVYAGTTSVVTWTLSGQLVTDGGHCETVYTVVVYTVEVVIRADEDGASEGVSTDFEVGLSEVKAGSLTIGLETASEVELELISALDVALKVEAAAVEEIVALVVSVIPVGLPFPADVESGDVDSWEDIVDELEAMTLPLLELELVVDLGLVTGLELETIIDELELVIELDPEVLMVECVLAAGLELEVFIDELVLEVLIDELVLVAALVLEALVVVGLPSLSVK